MLGGDADCDLLCSSMAKRYNMRLVLKQRFSEFFKEKVKNEQHRSLMMKMMALEVRRSVGGAS